MRVVSGGDRIRRPHRIPRGRREPPSRPRYPLSPSTRRIDDARCRWPHPRRHGARPANRRAERTGVPRMIVLIVVMVVVFGLLVFMWVSVAREPGPAPADVALAYERAWDELDFDLLYDLSG